MWWPTREDVMFITKKVISRRTVLRGMGATIALPLQRESPQRDTEAHGA